MTKTSHRLELADEVKLVHWLQSNRAEVALIGRDEVCKRMLADEATHVMPTQIARLAEAAGVKIGSARGKHSKRLGPNAQSIKLAILAKIVRRIGLELNALSDDEVSDLTAIVARRGTRHENGVTNMVDALFPDETQ